jgi:hypothetical protein
LPEIDFAQNWSSFLAREFLLLAVLFSLGFLLGSMA